MKEEQKALTFSEKISEYQNFQRDICYLVDLKDGKGTVTIKCLLGTSRDHGAPAS